MRSLGAKLGASKGRHRATPGHVQRLSMQVDATSGDARRRRASVGMCFGSRRPPVRNRPSDQLRAHVDLCEDRLRSRGSQVQQIGARRTPRTRPRRDLDLDRPRLGVPGWRDVPEGTPAGSPGSRPGCAPSQRSTDTAQPRMTQGGRKRAAGHYASNCRPCSGGPALATCVAVTDAGPGHPVPGRKPGNRGRLRAVEAVWEQGAGECAVSR